MRVVQDEQAVTVTLESVLLFSITVMLLGMVMLSFQSINEQASETVMREQYASTGNEIATKIMDMDNEIKAGLSQGCVIGIENELDLVPLVANKPYSIKLEEGKIILSSIGTPPVTVEVPFNPTINVVPGSVIYSTAADHALIYDPNGQIMFENGGVAATVDNQWPVVYIQSPSDMTELSDTVTIVVDTWDDVQVTKVEYYIDEDYEITVCGSTFDWEWDTTDISDGTYIITALVYDRAGHYSYDTRTYIVDNGIDTEPPTAQIIYPDDGSTIDYNPPTIQAIVRDNIAIDNDTIELWLDGVEVTANATITNTSLKQYSIEYTPPDTLSNTTHTLLLCAAEMFYGKGNPENQNVTLSWSFTIIPITDSNNPTIEISSPLSNYDLTAGEPLSVHYTVSDNELDDSGIDYLVINVSDNQSNIYTHEMPISVYPEVVKGPIQQTCSFDEAVYETNKSYRYNITVYDRAGNSAYTEEGPFRVPSGATSTLIADEYDLADNATHVEFNIRSSGPDAIAVKGMDVSFSSPAKLKQIYFDGNLKWSSSGGFSSTAQVTFISSENVEMSNIPVVLQFKNLNNGDHLIITIYYDETSETIELYSNP
jgi:hypothetical protein